MAHTLFLQVTVVSRCFLYNQVSSDLKCGDQRTQLELLTGPSSQPKPARQRQNTTVLNVSKFLDSYFRTFGKFAIYQYRNNMFLADNRAFQGCDVVKQRIINHSGCYNTAQLYLNLPIRLSYITV